MLFMQTQNPTGIHTSGFFGRSVTRQAVSHCASLQTFEKSVNSYHRVMYKSAFFLEYEPCILVNQACASETIYKEHIMHPTSAVP